jgi:RsiW-degrading membrane proteinase PrsW (M82 family)
MDAPLAFLLAQSTSEEGLHVIIAMLIVGLVFLGVVLLGELSEWFLHKRR